jgi:hypothetical protein
MSDYQFARDRGIVTATFNGVPLPLEKVFSSAKDGVAWGDSSDSTRNLAYSILKHHAKDETSAGMFAGNFVEEVLSRLTVDCWTISVQQIEEYINYRYAIGIAVNQPRQSNRKVSFPSSPPELVTRNVNVLLGVPRNES